MFRSVLGALAAVGVGFVASPAGAQAPVGPIVRVATGQLQGAILNEVEVFKGIPYAAPPVGEMRWKPPGPAASWPGMRPATAFGPICTQKTSPFMNTTGRPVSEDCLTLNIWTPRRSGRRPVMVWIHGGSWTAGSGAQPTYDGTAFAKDGVVLVTINYRLGALGYFAHPALTKAAGAAEPLGNYGQMDQIAALRWVQANISAFGGDPAQVTVFGESAGGGSVLALLATPSAKGLFSKAIVESGPAFGVPTTLAAAERAGAALAAKAGLPADATTAQLRALPAETIIANQGQAGPIVDGRLQPVPVEQAMLTHAAIDVPLIIGTNADEGSLVQFFPGAAEGMVAQLKPEERAQVNQAYGDEAAPPAKLGRALFSDFLFGAPARWIAGEESSGAPAWLYRFSYVTAPERDKVRGAQHAWELGYVFDTVGQGRFPATAEDHAYAKMVHSCWVSFAKTGAPTCTGAPAWPTYTPAVDALMHFSDGGAKLEIGFRKAQFDVVQQAVASRWAAGQKPTPAPRDPLKPETGRPSGK